MDLEFKFNANEFSKMLQITPSALRKRRLAGKLEGQYKKINQNYFYKYNGADRPNNKEFTPKLSRRRNVPRSEVRYHNARNGNQLQLANDLKQLARIKRSLSEQQIAEITPDIFEIAKQRRATRLKEQIKKDSKPTKNYGGWLTSLELNREKFKPTKKEIITERIYY